MGGDGGAAVGPSPELGWRSLRDRDLFLGEKRSDAKERARSALAVWAVAKRHSGRLATAAHHELDQAGWHISERLVVPPNITIVPVPAKCPELHPVENIWQFRRNNWLSNRVSASYDAIVNHCCDAWNRLADQPWRVMSIGLRE